MGGGGLKTGDYLELYYLSKNTKMITHKTNAQFKPTYQSVGGVVVGRVVTNMGLVAVFLSK